MTLFFYLWPNWIYCRGSGKYWVGLSNIFKSCSVTLEFFLEASGGASSLVPYRARSLRLHNISQLQHSIIYQWSKSKARQITIKNRPLALPRNILFSIKIYVYSLLKLVQSYNAMVYCQFPGEIWVFNLCHKLMRKLGGKHKSKIHMLNIFRGFHFSAPTVSLIDLEHFGTLCSKVPPRVLRGRGPSLRPFKALTNVRALKCRTCTQNIGLEPAILSAVIYYFGIFSSFQTL